MADRCIPMLVYIIITERVMHPLFRFRCKAEMMFLGLLQKVKLLIHINDEDAFNVTSGTTLETGSTMKLIDFIVLFLS